MNAFYSQTGNTSVEQFSALQANANLVWTMKNIGISPSLSRLGQVNRWQDSGQKGISLYPPTLSGSTALNLDASPLVATGAAGSLLGFSPNNYLTNEAGDLSAFLAQQYSFALYVRDVSPPIAGPQVERLIDFAPADGSQSGELGIDISTNTDGTATITAFDWFDQNNYAAARISLPLPALGQGLGIAVRFSNDPTKLILAVNGQLATGTLQGSPPLLGNVTRQLSIGGVNYGQMGSFELGEFAIWLSELSETQVTSYSQAEEQSFDLGGSSVALPGQDDPGSSSGFAAIQGLFTVCTQCHTQFASRNTVLAAVGADGTTPLVKPGNASGSLLIMALQHQSGALPMPKNLPQLSASDISQISDWIQNGAN